MNFSADINHKNRIRHLAASISLLLAASFLSELPIEARQVQDWPEGPSISAEAAIVMDANTKTILYSKNMDEKLYPASTTKIMTCLLAVENAKLDEQIVFSHDAVEYRNG